MRGDERVQGRMFATVLLEDRVPADHPLRAIRRLGDPILRDLSPQFEALSSLTGRPSIPPEPRLRALLLQLLYSIRSERQLVEPREYKRLYRWFVGLDLEASAWRATTVTRNRQRLLDGDIASRFLARMVATAEQARLLSREHCSVNGTLLEAWVSQKRVRPNDDDSDRPVDPGNDGGECPRPEAVQCDASLGNGWGSDAWHSPRLSWGSSRAPGDGDTRGAAHQACRRARQPRRSPPILSTTCR